MEMDSDFEYKRLTKDLLVDLIYLFSESGKRISKKDLLKKYDTLVFGAEYVGYIAYDKQTNLPVAFYGVIPSNAFLNGKKVLIAQSADTITHPNYRKKGLFIILANKTYKLCLDLGIKYLYGIPNYNSYKGFIQKLNWVYLGNFNVFTRIVFTIPLNYILQKTRATQRLYYSYVRFCLIFFEKKITNEKVIDETENVFLIPKNKTYLTYKLSNYHFKIVIDNVFFIISVNRFMKIGYYAVGNNYNFPKALRKLRVLAFFTGCHKIVFQELNLNSEISNNKFFESFKLSRGLPYIVKPISELHFSSLKIDYLDFDTF
jgi:hypothetical protein